jgi:hypothetical protein
MIKEIDIFIEK